MSTVTDSVIIDHHLVLTIETKPNIYEDYYRALFEREYKTFKFKGFRAGKVPMEIANKYLHTKKIREEAFERLIDATLKEIKESNQLIVYEVFDAVVKNEVIDYRDSDQVIVFKSYFETKPQITVGDYSSIPSLFEPKNLDDVFWVNTAEEKTDSSILCLKLIAKDVNNKPIFKYCHETLEVDLTSTKIIDPLLSKLKALEIKETASFDLTINDEKISFVATLLFVFNKEPIDEKLIKVINNPEFNTVEAIREKQKEFMNNYNYEFYKFIIIRWCNSEINQLSYIPKHNLWLETKKIFDNYKNIKPEQREEFLSSIFFENLAKIKVACVLEHIIEKENIECNEEDLKLTLQKVQLNPHLYSNITLDSDWNIDNNLIKNIAKQEKCILLLSKNIFFSN